MTDPNSAAFSLATPSTISFGLTKRELFAAMAMQGICSNNQFLLATNELSKQNDKRSEDIVATASVDFADALIAELNK